jgi:hypothetical protein
MAVRRLSERGRHILPHGRRNWSGQVDGEAEGVPSELDWERGWHSSSSQTLGHHTTRTMASTASWMEIVGFRGREAVRATMAAWRSCSPRFSTTSTGNSREGRSEVSWRKWDHCVKEEQPIFACYRPRATGLIHNLLICSHRFLYIALIFMWLTPSSVKIYK